MSTLLRACIVTLFLLAASRAACAQTGAATATLTGQVSAVVTVSAFDARALSGGAQVSVANTGANTIAVSISGSGDEEARVHVPLRLRSNTGYSLRASSLSPSDLTVRLSVAGVKATGKLVHADALAGIRLGDALADARGERASFLTLRNSSPRLDVLSGPPVSKAGTFTSPGNAIEIVLTIELHPHSPKQPWSTQLTITVAPNPVARQ